MQVKEVKKGGVGEIPPARGGVRDNIAIAWKEGDSSRDGMFSEEEGALAEEGT